MNYEQAKSDHSYLWSIGPANDMTGGYVDEEDLQRLLDSPSKRTAAACFCRQIAYWFQAGIEDAGGEYDKRMQVIKDLIESDEIVREIAIRHSVEVDAITKRVAGCGVWVVSLAEKLKQLRQASGASLQQVADAIGSTKPHIWELEQGKSSNPTMKTLIGLANYYRVSIDYLAGLKEVAQ